jgi:YfiH family protein
MQSSSTPNAHPAQDVEAIDALFLQAGLARSLRGNAAGVTRRVCFERATPEELSRAAPIPRLAPNGIQWLPVLGWDEFGRDKSGRQKTHWLWHGFSTRKGGLSRAYCAEGAPGELNLGFTAADDRETVTRNRQLLAEAVTGDPATPLVTIRQIHSSLLRLATAPDAARERPWKAGVPSDAPTLEGPPAPTSSLGWKADGLMTDEPGLLLGVQTADCIPVLVADRKRRAVAAFHAGWKGTVKRIVESGIGRMRLEFGSRPEDLVAAIGPGIGACCYAVGEEVLSSFESQFVYANDLFREVYDTDPVRSRYPMLFLAQRAPGHLALGPSLHLDLVEANRRQLLSAGLKPRSIKLIGGCTCCQPELFFSHRASNGRAGRMLGVIGIRPR